MCTFFSNMFKPVLCKNVCGACVVFHVQSTRDHLVEGADPKIAEAVTSEFIRGFVKGKQIGCVGTRLKFTPRSKMCNALHIQRSWFRIEDISRLDKSK